MGYNAKVYRKQGGEELVVSTSGLLTVDGRIDLNSGSSMTVKSGSGIALQSGSSFTVATNVEMQSGASIVYASGSGFTVPIQTLTSTQTATNVTNFGLSVLNGTSTGPTYTLAAPVVGTVKFISLNATSSAAAGGTAKVNSNTTGVSFDTTGGNQITFATSALRGVTLVAQTTAKWRVTGIYSGASIGGVRTT